MVSPSRATAHPRPNNGGMFAHMRGRALESVAPSDCTTVNAREQITLYLTVLSHVTETDDIFRETARNLIGLFPSVYDTENVLVEDLVQALRERCADDAKVDAARTIFQAAAAECLVNTIAKGLRSLEDVGNFVLRFINVAEVANGILLSSEARNKLRSLFFTGFAVPIPSQGVNSRDLSPSTPAPAVADAKEETDPVLEEAKRLTEEVTTSPKTEGSEESGDQYPWRWSNKTVEEVGSFEGFKQSIVNHVTRTSALGPQRPSNSHIPPLELQVGQTLVNDLSVIERPTWAVHDAGRNGNRSPMPYGNNRPFPEELSFGTPANPLVHRIYENGVSAKLESDQENDSRLYSKPTTGFRKTRNELREHNVLGAVRTRSLTRSQVIATANDNSSPEVSSRKTAQGKSHIGVSKILVESAVPRTDAYQHRDNARPFTRDSNGTLRYAAKQPNHPEDAYLPSTSDTPIIDSLWGLVPTSYEDRNRIVPTILGNIRRRGTDADFTTLVRDHKGRDANFGLACGGGIGGKLTGIFGASAPPTTLRRKLEESLRPFVLANKNRFLDIPIHDSQDLRSPVWQERPASTDQAHHDRSSRTSKYRRSSAPTPRLLENAGRQGHRYRRPPSLRTPPVLQAAGW